MKTSECFLLEAGRLVGIKQQVLAPGARGIVTTQSVAFFLRLEDL